MGPSVTAEVLGDVMASFSDTTTNSGSTQGLRSSRDRSGSACVFVIRVFAILISRVALPTYSVLNHTARRRSKPVREIAIHERCAFQSAEVQDLRRR